MLYGQERPASQGAKLTQYRLGVYNALGVFPNLSEARTAIEELGRRGVNGQHITLRGPAADSAANERALRQDNAAPDSALMSRWAAIVAIGAMLGGAVGFALAVPISLVTMTLFGLDITVTSILVSALLGALFGSIGGFHIASMGLEQDAEAWELSFHDTGERNPVVGVHSDNEKDVETARAVFEHLAALEVRVFGAETTPREAIESMNRSDR